MLMDQPSPVSVLLTLTAPLRKDSSVWSLPRPFKSSLTFYIQLPTLLLSQGERRRKRKVRTNFKYWRTNLLSSHLQCMLFTCPQQLHFPIRSKSSPPRPPVNEKSPSISTSSLKEVRRPAARAPPATARPGSCLFSGKQTVLPWEPQR